ncbi:uncharacterized protein LY89DRAFT_707311 [Mollisia scopiformis]|uniref:Monopolin complex subunit Csm1/Pcs1 C-terminal domain-containing protein n=1 Tax=Mollisia scopiformis TaxID=149040 RepID=A0A194X9M6_MOLSC|nr:uncharacterized protein LY89DRAFT_707311 [Mollisia scopiformis]KUJ16863.1 hypothetical protein LY89DRAFT_707311 [Mollisia scopiformis]
MPKLKKSTLSGLVDSDSDDAQFLDAMPTPDSAAENKAPGKKARGRPKVAPTKVTKTKAPARRTSGRLVAKAKAQAAAPTKSKRPALKDKTNQQYASETEEVDDFDANDDLVMDGMEVEETVVAMKPTKPRVTKKKAAAPRSKAVKDTSRTDYSLEDITPVAPVVKSRVTKRKAPVKKDVPPEPSPEKVIMETQVQQMEADDADEEVEETITKSINVVARPRSQSRPRQHSAHRRRAGSASDTERNDPALRRKLGEMTKKYENLQLKYSDLREIGLKEAERNCERIKKNSEEKTKISNDLIASLKADIAAQTTLAKESRGLKKKLESQNTDLATLQAQVKQLTASLSETQAENKTLSTKLAANRTTAASVESANSKVPGSAMKANGGIRMMGTAEAAQVAQAAQLKEDIYSDLTGLIIRNVKRESDEDVFDCIQTGRNGTLHFKLAAANEKSSESYEDAQCSYIPQLDPSRDKALIELMPEYLTDEITFPRPQAAKFYARVVKALTEKPA